MKQLLLFCAFALLLAVLVAASPPVILGAMTSESNFGAIGSIGNPCEQDKNLQGGADNKFPAGEFAGANVAKLTYAYMTTSAALNGAATANKNFSPRLAVTTDLVASSKNAQVALNEMIESIQTSGTVESAGMVENYSREFAENGRISSNVGGADNKFQRAVSTSSTLSGKKSAVVNKTVNCVYRA
ncbi:hypothetical protein GYA54_04360 [Candidatus Kuenenbacteria bacterium]|nr:hypothetical protein [Candidatus Kuenenbacteria bacterium]